MREPIPDRLLEAVYQMNEALIEAGRRYDDLVEIIKEEYESGDMRGLRGDGDGGGHVGGDPGPGRTDGSGGGGPVADHRLDVEAAEGPAGLSDVPQRELCRPPQDLSVLDGIELTIDNWYRITSGEHAGAVGRLHEYEITQFGKVYAVLVAVGGELDTQQVRITDLEPCEAPS